MKEANPRIVTLVVVLAVCAPLSACGSLAPRSSSSPPSTTTPPSPAMTTTTSSPPPSTTTPPSPTTTSSPPPSSPKAVDPIVAAALAQKSVHWTVYDREQMEGEDDWSADVTADSGKAHDSWY